MIADPSLPADVELAALAAAVVEACVARGLTIATAESCTGGLIGKYMTDLPGSSRVFWGGHVSYSNAAKTRLLGVEERIVREHGAVSEWRGSGLQTRSRGFDSHPCL